MKVNAFKNNIKLPLLIIYLNPLIYGVSNKNINSIQDTSQRPLTQPLSPFLPRTYQGIEAINDYGWYIMRKKSPSHNKILVEGKTYHLKDKSYISHPHLDFIIFKIDHPNDQQTQIFPKLQYLATPQDLQIFSGWVISCALISSNKKGSTENNGSKLLSVFSKIENQHNEYLCLLSGNNLEQVYQEIWIPLRDSLKELYLKNYTYLIHIENVLLEDEGYKQHCINTLPKELNKKIKLLMEEIDELLKYQQHLINCLSDLSNSDHGISSTKKPVLHLLESFENSNCVPIRILYQEINRLREMIHLKEKEAHYIFNLDNSEKLWVYYAQEIKKNKIEYLKQAASFNSLANYSDAGLREKKWMCQYIQLLFRSSNIGVADKIDNGGLILIPSQEVRLKNNEYEGFYKIVGLTEVKDKDNYIAGERSLAINLTTPDVHKWISDTIDKYYIEELIRNPSNKRPAEELQLNDTKRNRK